MVRYGFIFIILLLYFPQVGLCQSPDRKLNPIVQLLVSQPVTTLHQFQKYGVRAAKSGSPIIPVFVRTNASRETLLKEGYPVNSFNGNIATMDLTVGEIFSLSKRADVISIEGSVKRPPVLDVSAGSTLTVLGVNTAYVGIDARSVHSRGITGAGVVIGDVDTGIDYTHEDFQSTTGSSRILYIWDQNDNTGPNPSGFNYGTEYAQAQINLQLTLSTATVVRQQDTNYHGTHVMGIAAGNGRATGNGYPTGTYIGIAPQADIIMVNTDFVDTHIVDGVNYIFSKASVLNKPAVVNLSIGGQYGPHDGTDLFESSIDSNIAPGHIVVVAAGNDGNSFFHAEHNTPLGITDTTLFATWFPNQSFDLDLWYKSGDSYTCEIVSPGGTFIIASASSIGSGSIAGGSGTIYNNTYLSPNSDHEIFITFSNLTLYGTWLLLLSRDSSSSGSGHFDAWYSTQNGYFTSNTTQRILVTEPGHVKNAITVGAYCTKTSWISIDSTTTIGSGAVLGNIAVYSGIGPSRDSTFKPEIAAPGQFISSSLSSQVNPPKTSSVIMPDGKHDISQGTSFASPHAAGAVALLLQQHPSFDSSTIKNLLKSQGTKSDFYTGSVPDYTYHWGYGKLNANSLIPGSVNIENWQFYK